MNYNGKYPGIDKIYKQISAKEENLFSEKEIEIIERKFLKNKPDSTKKIAKDLGVCNVWINCLQKNVLTKLYKYILSTIKDK